MSNTQLNYQKPSNINYKPYFLVITHLKAIKNILIPNDQ